VTKCHRQKLEQMEEIDVCSLFGNMLDNALEACMKMTEDQEKKVEICTWCKGNYQIVQVRNTYRAEKNKKDFFKTDKTDVLNHGYGMKLIEKICQKYKGELRVLVEQDYVEVTAYLSVQ